MMMPDFEQSSRMVTILAMVAGALSFLLAALILRAPAMMPPDIYHFFKPVLIIAMVSGAISFLLAALILMQVF